MYRFNPITLGAPMIILMLALIVAILWFEIAMVISVLRNAHISDEAKVLWIIGMFLLHPFVAIAYYFTDHQKA